MSEVKNKSYSPLATLKRLLIMGKKYIPVYILLCIAAVIRSFLGVLDTESFRRMINGATGGGLNLVKSGIQLGFIALVVGMILDFIIEYFGENLNFVSTRELQSKVASKLTKIKMIKYEGYHSGDLIDRLDNCASSAQAGLNTNIRTIIESIFVIIFSMAYLTYLNFQLMISTLIFMLLLPVLVMPVSKVLRKLYDKRQTLRVEKDSLVQDAFQGGEIVRSFSLSKRLGSLYLGRYNVFLKLVKRILIFEGFMFNIHFVIILGGDLFILGLGAWLVSKGSMDVGGVLSFLIMFERIMQPISQLASIWPQLQVSISSANKVFEILDLPDENENDSNDASSFELKDRSQLNLENIRFSYKEEVEILKGLSFICEGGKVTALVGPSGSGKSTILKMLLRLYEPSSGEILCNETPISSLAPEQWREHVSYVSQDPLLFSGTIEENIKYGTNNVSDEEIIRAARDANIHELIMSTGEGYKSKIGEQGIRLSGGERQRVSIARAILRDPKILILDEPTSALDSENERLIQEALNKLMVGRTTVIVAHRLSTIQGADKIVFIDEGIAQEQGTHEELMKLRGRYYEMHEKINETRDLGFNTVGAEGVAL